MKFQISYQCFNKYYGYILRIKVYFYVIQTKLVQIILTSFLDISSILVKPNFVFFMFDLWMLWKSTFITTSQFIYAKSLYLDDVHFFFLTKSFFHSDFFPQHYCSGPLRSLITSSHCPAVVFLYPKGRRSQVSKLIHLCVYLLFWGW